MNISGNHGEFDGMICDDVGVFRSGVVVYQSQGERNMICRENQIRLGLIPSGKDTNIDGK